LPQNGWIDLVSEGKTQETFRAIIKVQGNTMDLCIGTANGARPTEFKSDSSKALFTGRVINDHISIKLFYMDTAMNLSDASQIEVQKEIPKEAHQIILTEAQIENKLKKRRAYNPNYNDHLNIYRCCLGLWQYLEKDSRRLIHADTNMNLQALKNRRKLYILYVQQPLRSLLQKI
jgi:hypothetical protein